MYRGYLIEHIWFTLGSKTWDQVWKWGNGTKQARKPSKGVISNKIAETVTQAQSRENSGNRAGHASELHCTDWEWKGSDVFLPLHCRHCLRLPSPKKSPGISCSLTDKFQLPGAILPIRRPSFRFRGANIHHDPTSTIMVRRPKGKWESTDSVYYSTELLLPIYLPFHIILSL